MLSIEGLSIAFCAEGGEHNGVVRDFSLQMSAGEIVALIGESGSGKTMVARSIPRPLPPAAIAAGSITLRGIDLFAAPEKTVRAMRGSDIGFVFQEPLVALNPAMRIGGQLDETLRLDRRLTAAQRRERIVEMLERLHVPRPRARLRQFPHEFSGGMRQRIAIAIAMMRHPALLIADEPTTALDALLQSEVLHLMLELARETGSAVLLITHDLGVVADVADRLLVMEKGDTTVQAQVLKLLCDLQRDRGFTLLFISHDLAVVGEIADRILVMCAGHPLETGSTAQIFGRPLHPYTRELLRASACLQADGGEHRYVLRHWQPMGTLAVLPAEPFPADADESMSRHLIEVEPGHFVAVGALSQRFGA